MGCQAIADELSKKCVATEVDTSQSDNRATRVLFPFVAQRSLQSMIRCHIGPDFTSLALDALAYRSGVKPAFIRPGKPT